jgi:glycosyltransferase involved in cell wall biosynthesis
MRFWIVNPFDPLPGEPVPLLRYGSAAKVMAQRGHEVTWWSADFNHREKAFRQPYRGEVDGLRVEVLPVPPYRSNISRERMRSHAVYAQNFLETAKERVRAGELAVPDVIWVSLPPLQPIEAALSFRTALGAKVVLDWMDLWPDTFYQILPLPQRWRPVVGRWLFRGLRRSLAQACLQVDAMTGVAEHYLRRAKAAGAQCPMCCTYHGIEVEPLPTAPADWKPRRILRLVYIGSMGRSYDLATVLKAVRQMQRSGLKLQLHIAGQGQHHEQRLRRLSTGWGLDETVHWHGYLNKLELKTLLSQSHIGLIPMFPESQVIFPYKAADYAEAGLAIFSSLKGELSDYLNTYPAGQSYTAGNAESLVAALKSVWEQPAKLAAMRIGARQLAEEKFDRSKTYVELAEFFERL